MDKMWHVRVEHKSGRVSLVGVRAWCLTDAVNAALVGSEHGAVAISAKQTEGFLRNWVRRVKNRLHQPILLPPVDEAARVFDEVVERESNKMPEPLQRLALVGNNTVEMLPEGCFPVRLVRKYDAWVR